MTITFRALARGLAAACAFATVAAAPVTLVPPQGGVGTSAYVQRDANAALGGIVISVAAGSLRETANQNGIAVVAATALDRAPVDGVALRDAIASSGGSLDVDVTARAARFYVEAPPGRLAVCVALLGRVLAHPQVSDDVVVAARRVAVTRATDNDRLPLEVGLGMVREAYYNGAAGQPIIGRTATLASIAPADVAAFIGANYRRPGVSVAAVGAVDDASLAAAQAVVASLPDGGMALPAITVQKPTTATRRIVTHRDIGAPWLVLGFAAPAPGGRDYATMLVLEAVLASTFETVGPVTRTLYGRSTGYVYATDLRPAQFAVYVNGGQLDIASGLKNIDLVLKALGRDQLRPNVLAEAKTRAAGMLAVTDTTLEDRATALVLASESGIDPAHADTAATIAAVTTGDVLKVAKAYLQRYTAAVVFPRDHTAAPAAGS